MGPLGSAQIDNASPDGCSGASVRMHGLFLGDDFKRTRLFGDYPFLSGAAAVTPTRCGISDEKPDFKISGDRVWEGGMRNANVAGSEGEGCDGPPLEISTSIISDERSIAPSIVEVIDQVVILRKYVIDVPPLRRVIMVGYKFSHFLIVDDVGNRRWRWRR